MTGEAAPLGAASVELPNRRATRRLARRIGAALAPGDALILSGPLGAGKTFLVRALCRALGLPEREPVQSPTFTLLREWPTRPRIAHADLYRLGSLEEAELRYYAGGASAPSLPAPVFKDFDALGLFGAKS